MLSATGLTAGAAVLAIAATTVLVTQEAAPARPAPAAGAALEAPVVSTFTGTRAAVPDEQVAGTTTEVDGVTRNRGYVSNGVAVESSDERFSGMLDFTMHEDRYGRAGVFWGEQVLRNDDGAWTGTLVGAGDPSVGRWRASNQMVGSGAYEGLIAIVYFDSDLKHQGVILPGPLPPRE